MNINNNNKNKKIYIDRLFPNVNDMGLGYKLKINEESIMYITIPDDAEQITKIIINHTLKYFTDCQQICITDTTAGVGGNTISFAQNFKSVNAIEINQERFNYLSNNVNAYQITNVDLYHGDCLEIVSELSNNDVIFIDPPWGGKNYKDQEKIRLVLGEQEIEDVCLKFLDKEKMKSVPKLLVLKLPKNYDIEYIYNKLKSTNDGLERKIYFYLLSKMAIIAIELN